MRTSIDLDRELVRDVMRELDIPTMREAVERGLRELQARQRRLRAIARHYGRHLDFVPPQDTPGG